jgi:predicted transcriptional regulator
MVEGMAHSKITISIPEDAVLERARAIAERTGRSLSAVIYRALRDAVILDEGGQAAAVDGLPADDEATKLAEQDADAMEADYRAAAKRGKGAA